MQASEELYIQQIELEEAFKREVEQIRRLSISKEKEKGNGSSVPVGSALVRLRLREAMEAMTAFVETTTKPKRGAKPSYMPILQHLMAIYPATEENHLAALLATVTLNILIDNTLRKEFRLNNIAMQISQILEEEARLESFLQQAPEHRKSTLKGIKTRIDVQYRTYYAKRRQAYETFLWRGWDRDTSRHLGAKLVEIIIQSTGYFDLHHGSTYKGSSQVEVKPTHWFLETWAKNESILIDKTFRFIPTLIPPKPWEDLKNGGYHGELAEGVSLLRRHDLMAGGGNNSFSKAYIQRLSQLELTEVKAAINAIQATPWKINPRVLEVAIAINGRGGDLAGLPATEPIPKLPKLDKGYTEDDLQIHKTKAVEVLKLELRRRSKALRAEGILKIARKFKDYSHIYFPHNMDFRGRVYPISSFSPQGDDLNKGLIELADVLPLKDHKDVEWLMIHGANLAGVDKVSFEDRIQWVKDNQEHILASAANPLDYLWWEQQDCPFQFLAFCFEWERYQDHLKTHKTPKGFITGVCVAFDGTCSGLQHFSAILRDPVGAGAVNLIPSDKPQDIYSIVAEKVNESLKEHAMRGSGDAEVESQKGEMYLKFGTKTLAQQWLAYGVNRKVTKRSVMTLPYGSREYGFRDQILEDTINPAKMEGRGAMFISEWQAAGYLAKLIWDAVNQVVVKAVEGMAWLQDMARLVAKHGRTVTWRTPMGLPIQQSYMAYQSSSFELRILGKKTRLYNFKPTGDIDKRAQASGIAPNFIHSLDAAHLQLTVLNALKEDIKHFAMIHDSYGTCVAQAGDLFRIIRSSFVEMYQENDVFQTFKEDMEIYLDETTKLPKMPSKGTFDLAVIPQSLYAFA